MAMASSAPNFGKVPKNSHSEATISKCIRDRLSALTNPLFERLKNAWRDSTRPIKPKAGLKSKKIQKIDLKAVAQLQKKGVRLERTDKITSLEDDVNNGDNPDIAPGPDGKKFYGTVYKIKKLPPPAKKGKATTWALEHPEMEAYLQKLHAAGYELVIDTSIISTQLGAYHSAYEKVIALRPNSTWQDFLHEFQHFEFARSVRPRFAQLLRLRNIDRRDLLKDKDWVRIVGYEKLKRIQELIDRGITPELAINEQLSVDAELAAIGWKRYLPYIGTQPRKYALEHRITELQNLGDAITAQQKSDLIKAQLALRSLQAAEIGTAFVAPPLAVIGLLDLALTTEHNEVRATPNEYVQIYYDLHGNIIGERHDGTLDLITKKEKEPRSEPSSKPSGKIKGPPTAQSP
jgi:hypothetical protein